MNGDTETALTRADYLARITPIPIGSRVRVISKTVKHWTYLGPLLGRVGTVVAMRCRESEINLYGCDYKIQFEGETEVSEMAGEFLEVIGWTIEKR